jgi:hypothetical protein
MALPPLRRPSEGEGAPLSKSVDWDELNCMGACAGWSTVGAAPVSDRTDGVRLNLGWLAEYLRLDVFFLLAASSGHSRDLTSGCSCEMPRSVTDRVRL